MMPTGPQKKQPVDTKERNVAENDLTRNLVIEAAAGTGKTTLLVSRLVNILINGNAKIGEILAITFTEKAAVELNERLRERLEQELQGSAERSEQLTGSQKDSLCNAIEDLESAQISTIHAFCRSILAERPFEAKLDPGMETLSEAAGNIYFKKHWERWLHGELSPENASFASEAGLESLFRLGIQTDKLEQIVYVLQRYRDVLDLYTPVEDVTEMVASLHHEILEKSRSLIDLLKCCPDPSDKGFIEISKYQITLDHLQNIDPRYRDEYLLQMKAPSALGNQNNWDSKFDCAEQKTLCKALQTLIPNAQDLIKAKYFDLLFNWLKRFLVEYHRQKILDGVVDFDDLLNGARDLVRDDLSVRGDLQNRFKFILVDEFQDTDPLQVELVFLLAQDKPFAVKRWQDVKLRPGKLFLVGDPKQSIYRFRRADIEIYEEAKNKVCAEGGSTINISQNFRTVPRIVNLVNDIFKILINNQDQRDHQAEYVPLDPYISDEVGSRVYFLTSERPLGEIKADDQKYHEAVAIASSINKLANSDPYAYRDIAILFATQFNINILEEALGRFNIPYIYESGKHFFERREIVDIKAVIAAIHRPWDELSVFAALRSQFFMVTDGEIFLLKQKYATLNPLKITEAGLAFDELNASVLESVEIISKLHNLSLSETPQIVLTELLMRTAILRSMLALGRKENDIANIQKIIDKARLLKNDQNFTFGEFSEWLDTQGDSTNKEPVVPAGLSEINAIRLMTVHSSKGLEFPVVYLANLTTGGKKKARELILDRRSGKIGFNFVVRSGGKGGGGLDLRSENFSAMIETENEIAEAEFIRLCYVACTRAKKRLYVPLIPSKSSQGGFQQYFFSHLELDPKDLETTIDLDELSAKVNDYALIETFHPLERGEDAGVEVESSKLSGSDLDALYHQHLAVLLERPKKTQDISAKRVTKITPSTVSAMPSEFLTSIGSRTDEGDDMKVAGKQDGLGSRDISGKELGTIFHRMISEIPMAGIKKLDLSELRQFWQINVPQDPSSGENSVSPNGGSSSNGSLERLLLNFLDSDLLSKIRNADRVLQEVPFVTFISAAGPDRKRSIKVLPNESRPDTNRSVASKGVIVEGKIDLLIIKDGKVDIVDLKTDRLVDEKMIAASAERYRSQMDLYEQAVRHSDQILTGALQYGRTYLYYAFPDELIELSASIKFI